MKNIITIFSLFITYSLNAQFIEDGLRLTQTENGISPRSNALGISYYGLNDDGSALYYNPAGLVLAPASEIQAGIALKYITSDISYLKGAFTNDRSSQYLSNFTFIAPYKELSQDGDIKFAFGLGYFRDQDYYNYNNFSTFNGINSYIGANSNSLPIKDMGLANQQGFTPLTDSLQQNYSLLQDGHNSRFTGGFAFTLGTKFALGVNVSAFSSGYSYTKKLDEVDALNKYQVFDQTNWTDIDFNSLYTTEYLNHDVSGLTGSIGAMATPTENTRVFLSVDLPNYYTIVEDWKQKASANFDNLDYADFSDNGSSKYYVTTPFKFNLGVSYNIIGFTFTGGMSYMNPSSLKFKSDNSSGNEDVINDVNLIIPERLASAKIDWGVGVEYQLPIYPIFLRASYSSKNTPYRQGFIDQTNMKTIAVGAGFMVGKKVMLDFSISSRQFDETTFLYANQAFNNGLGVTNALVGFSYRF